MPGPRPGPSGPANRRPAGLPRSLRVPAALATVVAVWLVGAFAGWWRAPIVGWAPLPVLALLCARYCWQTVAVPGLTRPARRLWRLEAIGMSALTVGVLSNLSDALLGADAPTQRVGPVTMVAYVAAILIPVWGLVRLPSRPTSLGGRLLFTLDSGAVIVTAVVFVWHFSFRHERIWTTMTGSVWPLVIVAVLAVVAVLISARVTFVAPQHMDRTAMRLFAVAAVSSAVGAAVSPALAAYPYVSNAHLSVPLATVTLILSARRQRQTAAAAAAAGTAGTAGTAGAAGTAGEQRHTTPRRWSLLPYTAIAATDVLLLVGWNSSDGRFLAAGAVALTAVVVLRQIVAFAHNNRLLTEVDSARDELLHQTTHDDLTGLGNRRMLHERITAALAGPDPERVHLVLIDLDDFKTVNDRLGHHVGDELIVSVGRRLEQAVAAGGTVVRLGGDEFAVLLRADGRERADAAVERLAGELQRPVHAGQYELLVHASLGITGTESVSDARELMRRADVAMYAAKDRGKHRIARYEPAMDNTSAEQSVLGAQLRKAMDLGEFYLLYQPIVALPGGELVGVEALVRWSHPLRGEVSPAMFVPVAERNGLIVPMGEWILREACRQAVAWRARPGGEQLQKVSVNVSARQLREPEFPATVEAILAETGLDPALLTLEITETAVFDGGAALASVHALHRMGVPIALDDFGTGHSSLGLLQTCPVDVLKVDKSFIDEIVTGAAQQTVVASALIHIADGMHLQAVAEGVETAAQAERLHDLGYRYAQGFHFARPMPAAALGQRLEMAAAGPVFSAA